MRWQKLKNGRPIANTRNPYRSKTRVFSWGDGVSITIGLVAIGISIYFAIQSNENNERIEAITTPVMIEITREFADSALGLHVEGVVDPVGYAKLVTAYRTANLEAFRKFLKEYQNNNPRTPFSFLMTSLVIQDENSKIALLDTAIDMDSSLWPAFYMRGSARFNRGEYEVAIIDFTKAIELKPNYSDAYYNRGLAKHSLGNYQDAIEDYNKAIEINPGFAEAFNNRGNSKYNLGDNKGAIADYNICIGIKPNNPDAFNNRGNAKFNIGKINSAILDYNKAITLSGENSPEAAKVFNNRGLAKDYLGDYNGAIADYCKAIGLKPNYAEAFNNRGNSKLKKRDYPGAIEDFKMALEIDPNLEEANTNLRLAEEEHVN